jgi:hypothetical protein
MHLAGSAALQQKDSPISTQLEPLILALVPVPCPLSSF